MDISLKQSKRNNFPSSPNLMQFKGVYDYFVLCKMFRMISEHKNKPLAQKTDNQLFGSDQESSSRANNKLVLPRYS